MESFRIIPMDRKKMDKRDLALSFADDPELYDFVRVGYPDELFKCLLDKVQIKEHQRVLEI
ncbi:hypothetical protein [Limnofasciculus baicalensis]|nr:hypothetical protein [Limnofasciculus baicalensis]